MINFDLAMTYLLDDEGKKYVNDPKDPGGPTKFGITLTAYRDFVKHSVTAADIAALTLDQAKDFYLKTYWDVLCWRLESATIAICIFDCAVLYGPGTAAKIAQQAINNLLSVELKLDGNIGDKTVEILNRVDEEGFLLEYHDLILERIDDRIKASPAKEVYRHGWALRAERLLTLNDLTGLIKETEG